MYERLRLCCVKKKHVSPTYNADDIDHVSPLSATIFATSNIVYLLFVKRLNIIISRPTKNCIGIFINDIYYILKDEADGKAKSIKK